MTKKIKIEINKLNQKEKRKHKLYAKHNVSLATFKNFQHIPDELYAEERANQNERIDGYHVTDRQFDTNETICHTNDVELAIHEKIDRDLRLRKERRKDLAIQNQIEIYENYSNELPKTFLQ